MAVDGSRKSRVNKLSLRVDRTGIGQADSHLLTPTPAENPGSPDGLNTRALETKGKHVRVDSTTGRPSTPSPVISNDLPHFLSRAAQSLVAEASTFLDTVRNTIRSALPDLGDFGFLDVIDDGEVRRVALAPRDAAMQASLEKSLTAPRWADVNKLCALSSGVSALHLHACENPDEDGPAAEDGPPSTPPAFRSLISVPMRYRGDLVAALTLFMGRSGRVHSAQHVACAEELATVAAPIVVNSRLVEQHLVARDALQRSEEFLRTATEAGELGLWAWDIQSDRIVCSQRLYELHGLTPDCPANRSADFISLVHPDDLPHVNAAREAAFAGTCDYAVEFRPIRPDGRTCWLSARAQVFRDDSGKPLRMIGATIDVTHRVELLARERRARAEAESARQRLELLGTASAKLSASLSPDSTLKAITKVVVPQLADWCLVALVDACGRLGRMTLNHQDPERARVGSIAAHRMFASTPEVVPLACLTNARSVRRNGLSAVELTSYGDPEMHSLALAIGSHSYCVVPLIARGRQIGAMAIFQAESRRDITQDDRDLLEALAQRAAVALDNARLYTEAEEARRQAEEARRAAEDANKAKDAFLAMLGHELRNPLAPIVTNLKLLALRDDVSSRAERLVIERQVGHLGRLVDDLLDVARIARGDVQLRRQRVLVKDILQKAIETVTHLLESRRHRLELHCQPDAADELAVDGDEHRLVQVVSNLLTNAARYTPHGGNIVLRADLWEGACRIVVRDNGRGIDKDLLPRIFDIFFQGQQGPDRANGGLGIGLAIVKNLVALHGGEVAAHSEGSGHGSSFVVRLPVAPRPLPQDSVASPTPVLRAPNRKRILLVDDNQDALESMCVLLELSGHEVRTAADPIGALALAASFTPEIAILDIGLPGMNGYDLAGRLRAVGLACRLFALTGYGLAEDRARSRAAGFEHHLVKPVDPDALLEALD